MAELVNIMVGVAIIILNLIPFALRKPKYLFLTIIVSLLLALLLMFFR